MQKPDSVFEFLGAIIQTCSAQLPRTCPCCGKVFSNFKQFISETTPIGAPQSAFESKSDPIGILTYVNCKCGSTMVLQCENMAMHSLFLQTIEEQSKRENKMPSVLLSELRSRVREKVLSLPD